MAHSLSATVDFSVRIASPSQIAEVMSQLYNTAVERCDNTMMSRLQWFENITRKFAWDTEIRKWSESQWKHYVSAHNFAQVNNYVLWKIWEKVLVKIHESNIQSDTFEACAVAARVSRCRIWEDNKSRRSRRHSTIRQRRAGEDGRAISRSRSRRRHLSDVNSVIVYP